MIIGTPETVAGNKAQFSHGGDGSYFVRTLLDQIPGSSFKYVRDLHLYPGSSVGDHLHSGDDEIFFIISGTGIMTVDGEARPVGPGTAVLTKSGSRHGLRNTGTDDLRVFVCCAHALSPA
ncbi:MAG: cupin domain-containing protein [Ardenticatenaceae bacterium]|nr:cupin domain-containing protein [Ardenticatenaceae bacterium]HBY97750.1 cupin domain-containing protein [Chloroflexota bacterium]